MIPPLEDSQSQKIIKGIEAYQYEQKVFIRLLAKRGSFTEKEFDKWFRLREFRRPKKLKLRWLESDSFILGAGSTGYWGKMLELLQHMMILGMVDGRKEGGIVVYRLGQSHLIRCHLRKFQVIGDMNKA